MEPDPVLPEPPQPAAPVHGPWEPHSVHIGTLVNEKYTHTDTAPPKEKHEHHDYSGWLWLALILSLFCVCIGLMVWFARTTGHLDRIYTQHEHAIEAINRQLSEQGEYNRHLESTSQQALQSIQQIGARVSHHDKRLSQIEENDRAIARRLSTDEHHWHEVELERALPMGFASIASSDGITWIGWKDGKQINVKPMEKSAQGWRVRSADGKDYVVTLDGKWREAK